MKIHTLAFCGVSLLTVLTCRSNAQNDPAFSLFQFQTNKEMRLQIAGSKAVNLRIDATTNLTSWTPLIALTNSSGTVEHVDTAAPWLGTRLYRSEQLAGPVFTGDYLPTDDGNVIIHPVFHATMVMSWKDLIICVDPTSDGAPVPPLRALPKADLILVTHDHGDHYNASTISAIAKTNAALLVSKSTFPLLPTNLKTIGSMMTNGMTTNLLGVTVRAIPAYNLSNNNHPKSNGNGYVITIGGKNLYIAGDTEDVPEMRALRGIDVAFICMDGQFTMSMVKAASAVREFQPKVVFPYHYNSQNTATFKQLVGTDLGIEVKLRKWQ